MKTKEIEATPVRVESIPAPVGVGAVSDASLSDGLDAMIDNVLCGKGLQFIVESKQHGGE